MLYDLGQGNSICLTLMRPNRSLEGRIFTMHAEDSRPQSKQTRYVRCLIVKTRLRCRWWHPKMNWKTPKISFINLARAGGVRNFRWHPATRAEIGYWPELMQLSSQRLRSRC